MNKSTATRVRNEALKAIEALSSALEAGSGGCTEAESNHLHKQVGLAIGQIQMCIIEPIVAEHPDLDDLRWVTVGQKRSVANVGSPAGQPCEGDRRPVFSPSWVPRDGDVYLSRCKFGEQANRQREGRDIGLTAADG